MGRRKTDRTMHRVVVMLQVLLFASSVLSSVLAYRALRAMDEASEANEVAFKVGVMIGRDIGGDGHKSNKFKGF